MPSGEPAPSEGRRDRSLETLGGSTRLELGLGGVMRVLRRRGVLLLAIFLIAAALIYAAGSQLPKRYSSVAWIRINDQTQNLFSEPGKSVDLTKEQRAVVLTMESPRLRNYIRKQLGAQFKDVKAVSATGLEASPLIRIDATASTPTIAEKAANAGADFAVADRRDKQRADLNAKAADHEKSAAQLEEKVNAPERTEGRARVRPTRGWIRPRPSSRPRRPSSRTRPSKPASSGPTR